MITQTLKTIFPTHEPTLVRKNETYGFDIKLLQLKNQQCQLLFTDGLAKNMQPVNEKNIGYEHIELYFLLPDYWDLAQHAWPVYWLERIAQVPQKKATWFGVGDTLPAGTVPEIIDPRLACSYFILSKPLGGLEDLVQPQPWEKSPLKLLAVVPIFAKEFDFKTQNSSTALLQIFATKNITELVDIYRQPVARKKFMGLF